MDCSESSLCLQPVPLLGVKAAACLAQPKKPWKSLWRRDAIWNLHCSLPRTCLVGWTEERDQSPCPKRLQHKETSQIRGKTSQGSQSWCDRSLCFVSFPFSLSFPSSAWRGELKLLSFPAAEWSGKGLSGWDGWWTCHDGEKERKGKSLWARAWRFHKASAELRESFTWLKAKQETQHLTH